MPAMFPRWLMTDLGEWHVFAAAEADRPLCGAFVRPVPDQPSRRFAVGAARSGPIDTSHDCPACRALNVRIWATMYAAPAPLPVG